MEKVLLRSNLKDFHHQNKGFTVWWQSRRWGTLPQILGQTPATVIVTMKHLKWNNVRRRTCTTSVPLVEAAELPSDRGSSWKRDKE